MEADNIILGLTEENSEFLMVSTLRLLYVRKLKHYTTFIMCISSTSYTYARLEY